MSERVCCNCRRNQRIPLKDHVECRCQIDNHYISYVECMSGWCRHWAKDEWQEKEAKHDDRTD